MENNLKFNIKITNKYIKLRIDIITTILKF